jgi:hypothetical protein
MATYRVIDDTQYDLAHCATCAVIAEADCRAASDANTVCAMCGLPAIDFSGERSSYFEVIMRLGRPGPALWPRRSA